MEKIAVVLALLVLLTLALAVGLAFFFIIRVRTRLLKNANQKVKAQTSAQRQAVLELILKRVSLVARANHNYNNTVNDLLTIYKKFVAKFTSLKLQSKSLNAAITSAKFSTAVVKKLMDKFDSWDLEIKKLEAQFNKLSQVIVAQDDILRTEFYFYQKKLRHATTVYNQKRVLLEIVEVEINNFLKSIRHVEKEFERIIDQGDNLKAHILIQRYISKLVKFIKLINSGPALAVQLKLQIPKALDRINNIYFHPGGARTQAAAPVVQTALRSVTKSLRWAEASISKLDIALTSKNVRTALKGLATIEDNLQLEARARMAFQDVNGGIIAEHQRNLNNWRRLEQKFEAVAGSGKPISATLFESYNNAKVAFSKLKRAATSHFTTLGQEISYVTKLQQSTFFLEALRRTIALAGEFGANLKKIDLDQTAARAKFYRAERVLRSIVAAAKQKALVLTLDDHQQINEFLLEKATLAVELGGFINCKIKGAIENFAKRINNLYTLISSKMQMAFHIENIISECAPQRALSLKLNVRLQIAEAKYLEGDYAAGLNEVINCMREANLRPRRTSGF